MPLPFKKISDVCDKYINAGDLAGTQTLIYHHGKIVYHENKGFRDIEKKLPIENDTIFRIYSMTKPVTSVAAMILVDQDKLALHTPISEFIPEFKQVEVYVSGTADNYQTRKPEREITVIDLLNHTAGFTYDFMFSSVVDELYRQHDLSVYSTRKNLTEFAKNAARVPLLYSPGESWFYSIATDILGRVIEVVSGMTLGEFFKQNLFGPLNMVDTDFYVPKTKQSRFATNYIYDKHLLPCDDPYLGIFSKPPVIELGGTGLVSTASDYLNFARMLLNNGSFNAIQLLKPETVKLMTTNYLKTDLHHATFKDLGPYTPHGKGFGFGFGITIDMPDAHRIESVGMYEWGGAAHTLFFVDPQKQLIGLFLAQLFPHDYKLEMLREFKKAVYESID